MTVSAQSGTSRRRGGGHAHGGGESGGFRAFRVVALVVTLFVFVFPILWMVLASLKKNVDIFNPAKTLDFSPTLDNFVKVFAEQHFVQFTLNSFVVAGVSTLLSLVIGLPAAHAISRFAMKRPASIVLLARIMPAIALIIPWYFIFARLHLLGGYSALVIAHMFPSLPLIVVILISFFDGLPIELEEAAQVDGLTPIGAFVRVALPLSRPGIATAGLLSFIFSWNNFLFSLVLCGSDTKTLPVAIMDFIGYASIDWGGLMAATTAITVPIMVISVLCQKYVVSGFIAGAIKG